MSPFPAVDIGATGIVGIAFETVPGTYVAPTKFFPIISESLMVAEQNIVRRPIRGVNDVIGVIAGRREVKGDMVWELSEDVLPYFLFCSRNTGVKTGTTPNWIYTFTPFHGAIPLYTLSITVVRNGIVFGYVGCVVSDFEFDAADTGQTNVKTTLVGMDEAVQSLPTASYGTTAPFSAGQYTLQIPTGTTVYDMDKFTFTVNDNATSQWRLQATRAVAFINYGERTVQYKTERDFISRSEYDTYFIAVTAEAGLSIVLSKGANNSVTITLPKPLPQDFDPGHLTAQGALIRSAITYDAVYDTGTSHSYQIVVNTQETVTP